MKISRCIFLVLTLACFSLGKAQSAATAKPKQKFSYGVKANGYMLQFLDYVNNQQKIYGTDYSMYIQYKSIGVLGGYTTIYNSNFFMPYNGGAIHGFNAGMFFKIGEFNKNNKLYLYLYDTHCSGLTQYIPGMMLADPTIDYRPVNKKTNLDFVTFNPRYRGTFCKNILSVEVGAFISCMFNSENLSKNYDKWYPACGLNVGLGLNMAALCAKK